MAKKSLLIEIKTGIFYLQQSFPK